MTILLKPRPYSFILLLIGLTGIWASLATAGTPLRLSHPGPGEFLSASFQLERPSKLEIQAVGLIAKHGASYVVDAWILNHDTHRAVWTLGGKERDCHTGSRLLRRASDVVALDKGAYTVYLYAGARYYAEAPFKNWQHILHDLAALLSREDPNKNYLKYLDECFVDLALPAVASLGIRPKPGKDRGEPVIQLACAQDGIYFTRPFRVTRDTRVALYTVGEAIWRGEMLADYAWIEKAGNGQTVWLMDMPNCEHAGGALKNRYFSGEISLATGEYLLSYITDDSHSCERWNAAPPYDPEGWGVSLAPAANSQRGDILAIDFDEVTPDPAVLVKMIHVRDNEHRREKFKLERPTRVRVYALGEGGRGEMWDTAWIMDLKKRQTIWRMNFHETRNGGGDEKNRLYDGIIQLDTGIYEAHFATDDSHAFGSWNARPPREPNRWGLTLTVVNKD